MTIQKTSFSLDDLISEDSEEEALARQQIERQLEITLVRQWVESLPDGSIVGIAGYGCACPVANYLSAVNPDASLTFWVDYDGISVNNNGYQFVYVKNPLFLATFISTIDYQGIRLQVTKEQALETLNLITEGAS